MTDVVEGLTNLFLKVYEDTVKEVGEQATLDYLNIHLVELFVRTESGLMMSEDFGVVTRDDVKAILVRVQEETPPMRPSDEAQRIIMLLSQPYGSYKVPEREIQALAPTVRSIFSKEEIRCAWLQVSFRSAMEKAMESDKNSFLFSGLEFDTHLAHTVSELFYNNPFSNAWHYVR